MRDNAAVIFAFALGLVVGAFALLIFPGMFASLRGLAAFDDPAPAGVELDATGAIAAPLDRARDPGPAVLREDPELERVLRSTDRAAALDAIAQRLETAVFEGEFDSVGGIASRLREAADRERERAVAAVAERVERGEPDSDGLDAPEERSLTLMRHQMTRRATLSDLEARRNEATGLLGRRDEEAVEKLVRLLRTATEGELRRDAALVLGLSATPRAREVLAELLRTGGELDGGGTLAAEALCFSDDFLALTLLAQVARDELDPRVRLQAVQGLGGCGPLARGESGPVASALVASLAEDADAEVRRTAAAALASADLDELRAAAEALLVAARRDAEAEVRLAAVAAILENHRISRERLAGVQEVLLEVVGQDGSAEVRRLAIEALGEIGDQRAADALQALAQGLPADVGADVPAALERIRGRIGDDAARPR